MFGFSVRVGLQSETCHPRLVNACPKPPSVRKFDHVKALGCLASKVSLLGKLPSHVLAGPWSCSSSIAGRHTNVEPRLQCTRSKRSRMITTAVALLGLIGLFYSLPAVTTWVKVALCGTLGLAHVLSQVMSWTVQDGNISTAFVLQFLLTFVCLKLRIQNLGYPWLLSTGSSWAGTNQAFGWVMDVPEAKRKQICVLVPEESAASKKD